MAPRPVSQLQEIEVLGVGIGPESHTAWNYLSTRSIRLNSMDEVADKTAAINMNGADDLKDGQEPSKNALKKAAKQAKLAEEKANKSATNTTKESARAEAKKAVPKAPKKKIEGAALVGIDVAKEVDFPGWYQQVLTKGEFLDYYDVSGCYILRV